MLNENYIDFYNDGRIEEKGNYKNNLKDGIWKVYFYYKEDIFESSGTFKNGKKLDDWQTIKIHSIED